MVLPPYLYSFLLQLCDVWPSGRPSLRSIRVDACLYPHFRVLAHMVTVCTLHCRIALIFA